ncbi:riboflavin synthase [Phenylobacterium sp.]|uniref:riboflavin synthase n=1 Tax=Phenylobacterium sp. TaxID=1871053 RepID=UPI003BAC94AA
MFSGIVERIGRNEASVIDGPARRAILDTGFDDLTLGESIAVNDSCLTVLSYDAHGMAETFIRAETLARTNLGAAGVGARVNLARALPLATRLSGHLVQGHVDGKARLSALESDGEARRVELSLPADLYPFCVEKGSITLHGVRLTLNTVGDPTQGAQGEGARFAVAVTLIPHTWIHTNLQHAAIGDEINVEVDVLGKHVERLCHAYLTRSNS